MTSFARAICEMKKWAKQLVLYLGGWVHKDVEIDFSHELTYESCKISHLDVSESS